MEGYCYHYDGTFAGFLTCIRDIYQYREPPALFLLEGDYRPTFYEDRWVTTDPDLARQVYRRLGERLGPRGRLLVAEGFLSCLDHREQRLYRLIDFGLQVGPGVEKHLENDQVLQVGKAVRHLQREAHLFTGFVRFTDYRGVLIGEIAPKNQVLPLVRPHFCTRFAGETFFLFDKTHRQLLVHQPDPGGGLGRWAILPAEDFTVPDPSREERDFRDLWRRFYDTVAIQGRYNPRCRQTHMPKRYWGEMTELQGEVTPPPSPAALPTPEGEGAAWPQRRTPSDRDTAC